MKSWKRDWHFNVLFTPRISQIFSNSFFLRNLQRSVYLISLWKIYDFNPIISCIFDLAKIGLSCDIKSLFQKSVDKKFQIFNAIFCPVLLHFFNFFYNNLIPLSNIFRSQKNYQICFITDKVMVTYKDSLHNKN